MKEKWKINSRLMIAVVALIMILAAMSVVMLTGWGAANSSLPYGTYDKKEANHGVDIFNFTPDLVSVDASDLSGNDVSKFNPSYANPSEWKRYKQESLSDAADRTFRAGKFYETAAGIKNISNFVNIKFKNLKDGYVPITVGMRRDDYSKIIERKVRYEKDGYEWQYVDIVESIISFMTENPTDGLSESKHKWVTPDYGEDSGGMKYTYIGMKNDDSTPTKEHFVIVAFAVPCETNSIKVTTKSTESLAIGAKFTYEKDWEVTAKISNTASYPVLMSTEFIRPSFPEVNAAGSWDINPVISFSTPRYVLPGRTIIETKKYRSSHRTDTGWTLEGRVMPEDVFATASVTATNLTYGASKYALVAAEKTITKKFSCFFPGDPESANYDQSEINRSNELSVSGGVAIKHYAEIAMDKPVNIPTRNITVTGDIKLSTVTRIAMVVRAQPASSLGVKLEDSAPNGSSDAYKLKHKVYWWKADKTDTRKYENYHANGGYDKVPYYNVFEREASSGIDKFTITIPLDTTLLRPLNNHIYKDAQGAQTVFNTAYFDFYIFYEYQKQWEVSYDYLVNNEQYNIKPDFSTALRGKSENSSGSSAAYSASSTGNGLYDMSGKTFALVRTMNASGIPQSSKLRGTTTPTTAEMRYKALSLEILEDDTGSGRGGISTTTDKDAYTMFDGSKTSRKGTWYRMEGEVIRINQQLTLFRDRLGEGAQQTLFDNSYGVFIFVASDSDYLTLFSRGYSAYLKDDNYKSSRDANDRQYYADGGGTRLMGDIRCDLSGHSHKWYASQYYAGNFSFIFGSDEAAMKRLTKVQLLPYDIDSGVFVDDPVLSKIIKGDVSHLYPYQSDVGVGIEVNFAGAESITEFLPFIPDELMDFGVRKWFEEHLHLGFNLDEIRLPYTGGVPAMKFAEPLTFAAVAPMFLFEAGVTFEFDCNTLPEELDDAFISVKGAINLFDQLEVEGELILKWYNDGAELIPDRIALGFGSDLLGLPPEISIVAIEKIRGSIDGLGEAFGNTGAWDILPPISASLSADFSIKLDAKATEVGLHANDVGITLGFEGFEMFMESVTINALGAEIQLLDKSYWGISWNLNSQVDIFGDGTYIPFPTVRYYGSGGIDLGIKGTSLESFIVGTSSLSAELDTSVIAKSLLSILNVADKDRAVDIRQKLIAWKNGERDSGAFFEILAEAAMYASQELSSFTNAIKIEGEAYGHVYVPDGVPFVGGKTIVKGKVTYGFTNSVLQITANGHVPVLGVDASVSVSYDIARANSKFEWSASLFRAGTNQPITEPALTSTLNNSYEKTVKAPSSGNSGIKLLLARTRAAVSDWSFVIDESDNLLLVELYADTPMAVKLTNSGGAEISITAALATDDTNGWVADYGEYDSNNPKPLVPIGYRYTLVLTKGGNMGAADSTWSVPDAGLKTLKVVGLTPIEALSAVALDAGTGNVSFALDNQKAGTIYTATVYFVPVGSFDADGLPTVAGTVIALHHPVAAEGSETTITLTADMKKLLSGEYRAFVKIEKDKGADEDDRYAGIGVSAATPAAQPFVYVNPDAPAAPVFDCIMMNPGKTEALIEYDAAVTGYRVEVIDAVSGKAVNASVTTESILDVGVSFTMFTLMTGGEVIAGNDYYFVITPYCDVKDDAGAVIARIPGASTTTVEFEAQPKAVYPALETGTNVLTHVGSEEVGGESREIYYAKEVFNFDAGDNLVVGSETIKIDPSANVSITEWNIEAVLSSNEYSYKTDANGGKYDEVKSENAPIVVGSGSGATLAELLAFNFDIDCGALESWDDANGRFIGTSDRIYTVTLKYKLISGDVITKIMDIRFVADRVEVEFDSESLNYDGSTLAISGRAPDDAALSLRYRYIDADGAIAYSQPVTANIIRGSGSFAYSAPFAAEQIREAYEVMIDGEVKPATRAYYNIELVATDAIGGETVYTLLFDVESDSRLYITTSLGGSTLSAGMSGITLSAYYGGQIEPLEASEVTFAVTEGGDKLRIEADGSITALAAGTATVTATYGTTAARLILEVEEEAELVPVALDSATDTSVTISVGDVVGGGDITAEISADGTAFQADGKVEDGSYIFTGLSPFTNYTVRFTPEADSGYTASTLQVRTMARIIPADAIYSVVYDAGDSTDGRAPVDPEMYAAGGKVTLRDINTAVGETRLTRDGTVVSGFSTQPGGYGEVMLYGIDGYDYIIIKDENITLYPIFADSVVYDQLRSLLGLEDSATVADVITGLDDLKKDNSAVYSELRDALGLGADATLGDFVTAINKLESDGADVYAKLRTELGLSVSATLDDILAAINALEAPTNGGDTDDPPEDGLPFGAGIGIGIGATAALGIISFAVYWFILRKRLRK